MVPNSLVSGRDWDEQLPRALDELDQLLTDSEIIKVRTIGVGYLPPELGIALSASGPLLRGSGVAYDIRRSDPYSIYPELDFDVAVRYNGDNVVDAVAVLGETDR